MSGHEIEFSMRDDFGTVVLPKLTALLSDRVVLAKAVREQHGHGEGRPDFAMPDAVVYPESTEEVSAIAAICYASGTPIIPFGAGSSVEGHVVPSSGGISLDLARMTKVLAINVDSMDCRVEAGVTKEQLNGELRDKGLFFPVDPGAHATIGGMAATRASGTNAVRYGTMREVTLGLTVVTPQGLVIKTGGRARKSSAGLDLTRLYVGSEGTLGTITEVALRLSGIPEAQSSAVCQFPDLSSAMNTVIAGLHLGLDFARVELADAVQMRSCIAYSHLEEFSALPTLFFEFHGSETGVREQLALLDDIAKEYGGSAFRYADNPEDRNRLWSARHNAYFANVAFRPGCKVLGTDACVPIDALAACITESVKDVEESGLTAPLIGHVGDGNFHLSILFDAANPEEYAKAEELASRVSARAIEYGGTCTGEHGVGLGKIKHMKSEHGDAIAIMKAIKSALDPRNIMNPGKMLPS